MHRINKSDNNNKTLTYYDIGFYWFQYFISIFRLLALYVEVPEFFLTLFNK